jgi:uncharacterized surface protein with fasciclin (FAS1) repeats
LKKIYSNFKILKKMKRITTILSSLLIVASITNCKKEKIAPDPVAEQLKVFKNITVFTDLMNTAGRGLLDINQDKTLFIPTDEAFVHLDIDTKRDYDKATMIAFLAAQTHNNKLPHANMRSGKLPMSNLDTVRVYKGAGFTQIEDALMEEPDLIVGKLTIHLVDRIFMPEVLTGHDHNSHAGGHSHGGTHSHTMTDNCGTAGPSAANKAEAVSFRTKTTQNLDILDTWLPNQAAPKNLPKGYSLMGGRNNGLPYIHYFSRENMEDGKFMDPNAPEGLMYGLTADGLVYPISAVYLTREASAAQLHTLNCIYMFHEHDGLPGIMMHVFHDKYPSTNGGFDHEADPILVRKMKAK